MMISLTLAQNTFIMANGNWIGQQSSHDGWTLGIVDTLLFINVQNISCLKRKSDKNISDEDGTTKKN